MLGGFTRGDVLSVPTIPCLGEHTNFDRMALLMLVNNIATLRLHLFLVPVILIRISSSFFVNDGDQR